MLKGEDSPEVFRKALNEQLYFVSKPKTLHSKNNYQKIIFINESKCLQIIGCNFVQYLQGGSWFRLFLFQFRWTHINYNSIAFSCIQILMYEKGKVLWKKYDDTYFNILGILIFFCRTIVENFSTIEIFIISYIKYILYLLFEGVLGLLSV